MMNRIFTASVLASAFASQVAAGPTSGSYLFISRQACAASGKFDAELCTRAEANATAEFEEKAPRFATRAACEQAYRLGACAISLRATGGRGGVSFTPRQQGFRIVARGQRDISTQPVAPGLNFSSRSALRQATWINPRATPQRPDSQKLGGAPTPQAGPGATSFGASSPDGEKHALPPPPPADPNFDCSAYIEPSSKADAATACAPAPNFKWRR